MKDHLGLEFGEGFLQEVRLELVFGLMDKEKIRIVYAEVSRHENG